MDIDATVLLLDGNRSLAFAEYGTPDGLPVFGFHGTPGSRLQLAVADRAAQQTGVRLILPDRPGYGYSDYVADRTLMDWPTDVVRLADHLRVDEFGVIGVSGGGPHALACASAIGERVTGVSVVSGVGPWRMPELFNRAPWPMRIFVERTKTVAALMRPFLAAAMRLYRRAPQAALRAGSVMLPAADRAVMSQPWVRDLMAREARHQSVTTAVALLQDLVLFAGEWNVPFDRVPCSVHLWQGDADRNVPPEHARALAQLLPEPVLHELPGEGHMMFATRAEEILRTML